jgi:hypothetical protein
MTSAAGSINAFFNTLPRTRVAIQGRVGGSWTMRVWWRRDSDHPMLLAVAKS